MKAEDLPGCLLGDMSDPRPLHLRNRPDRQHQMCNLVTNFVAHTGKDMAARYAIPKANLQVAVQDHDYLDAPFTEHLVQNYLEVQFRNNSLKQYIVLIFFIFEEGSLCEK